MRKDRTKVLKIFRLNGVERRDMAKNELNARRRCTMWVLFGNQRKAQLFTQNPDGMPKVKIGLDIPLYPRVAGICFEMQSGLGIAVLGCTAESSICQSFLET